MSNKAMPHPAPDVLCAQIEAGRYGRPFIRKQPTRRRYFSMGLIQRSMRIDALFALEFAYTRKMMASVLFDGALDWEQLGERVGALVDRFPPDFFSAIVTSLCDGAELRWAKQASCH